MALKKIEQPAFEDTDNDEAVAAAEASVAHEQQDAAVAAVVAVANAKASLPAVAKPRGGALTTPSAPVNTAAYDVMAAFENRMPPVDFGEGVRLVGSNGILMDSDKNKLGSHIHMTLLSWNKRWVVSPGKDGAEAREFARYSIDGKYTSKGEPVDEYIDRLRNELGYDKASLKEYIDLFGVLDASEKDSDHVGGSVTVSLSPDSVKAFSSFRRDIVVKGYLQKKPLIEADLGVAIKVSTEVKSGGGKDWTRLLTSLVL